MRVPREEHNRPTRATVMLGAMAFALAPTPLFAQLQPGPARVGQSAAAQPANTRASTIPRGPSPSTPVLQPVDQGTADLSPLSASNRVIPTDMRVPTGFDRLFSIPSGMAFRGNTSGRSQYIRTNGALNATFPQSSYLETQLGAIPLVAPNTVYWIGSPFRPSWEFDPFVPPGTGERPRLADAGARPVSLSAANARSGMASMGDRASDPNADPAAIPSVWNSEVFRRDLIHRVLSQRTSR